jgi:transposase
MIGKGGGVVMEEAVRLRRVNRDQLRLEAVDLDSLVEGDHPARAIWRVLEAMELSRFYAPIKAREGVAGQNATDPRILLALWLYGLSEGVASARELARLTEAHKVYRWICGGVTVNHHLLSDFRTAHGAAVDELMSQVLAVLMHKGLVKLHRVAQDGTRVRASAGAGSFRRKRTLERCLGQTRAHIAALSEQAEHPDPQRSARAFAAQQRAAREREQRVEQALCELEQLGAAKAEAKNHPQRKGELRVSTTDPQARVMKMADGGFRPAYNLQFATDSTSRIIVGVRAINAGSDSRQLEPMLEEIKRRTGALPAQHLADGGYMNFAAVEQAAARGVEVFSPPRENRTYHIDPLTPQPNDSAAIADYRRRMGSEQGKKIYQQRASTAETVNADLKTWRGLNRLLLRGTTKVLIVATWSALAYNLMRAIKMDWL